MVAWLCRERRDADRPEGARLPPRGAWSSTATSGPDVSGVFRSNGQNPTLTPVLRRGVYTEAMSPTDTTFMYLVTFYTS